MANRNPVEWTSTEALKRHRKALRDSGLAFILILIGWILLILLMASQGKAQELALAANMSRLSPAESLPSTPAPKVAPTPIAIRNPTTLGRFWDTPNRASALAMLGLAGADMAQTCRFLARGRHEDYLTQSCAGNVALTAAFEVGAITGARALHRMGHHKLERVPMLFMAGQSARALAYSKQKGGW